MTLPLATIQSRRKLIVIILLSVAVAGALIRLFAARGTTLRDVGTLMLLLWVPIIGNILGWLFGKFWRRRMAAKAARLAASMPVVAGFPPGSAFTPHKQVEIKLRAARLPAEDVPIPAGEHRCALVVDNQGYTARWIVPSDAPFKRDTFYTLPVEFLSPEVALPHFKTETRFRMLVGEAFVGDGRVLTR
ncbi:MAG: hypothetical protein ABW220_01085 [Burkholderiaceae bacterium]